MTPDDQADAYYQEVIALTDRFKEEFDMTYVQLIGVLETVKLELFCEYASIPTDDEDFEDGDT